MGIIRKLNGRFQADFIDFRDRRIRKQFDQKKEAKAYISQNEKKCGNKCSYSQDDVEIVHVKKGVSIGEALRRYEDEYKHQNSYINFKRIAIEHIENYFTSDRPIESISTCDISGFGKYIKGLPTVTGGVKTNSTVNRYLSVLSHLMSNAKQWELIKVHPFTVGDKCKLPEDNGRYGGNKTNKDIEIPKLLNILCGIVADLQMVISGLKAR